MARSRTGWRRARLELSNCAHMVVSQCVGESEGGGRAFTPALERGSDLRMKLGYARPPVVIHQ
jgi:hypothetical protein